MMEVLLNQHPGPLPLKGSFVCKASAPLDAFVQGVSVRKTGTQAGAAGCEIVITDKDGKQVGYTSGTIDGDVMGGRKATVSQWGQTKLNAGEQYNFEVRPVFPEVLSDQDDFFTAVIIY
ncbi:MAG TPA: hypothetical protein VJ901_05960 [Thermoanaerobaculia bacterium]|nr:hypothetical protein [Thermoanaerobaculia bacterium]